MADIKVERDGTNGKVTVSQVIEGDTNSMSNHELNQKVGGLLVKLAEEIAKEQEYEYDGVSEAICSDDGTISLVAIFFVP